MTTDTNNLPTLFQVGLWAVMLIAFGLYCRHVFAWTAWLEDRRAERNE